MDLMRCFINHLRMVTVRLPWLVFNAMNFDGILVDHVDRVSDIFLTDGHMNTVLLTNTFIGSNQKGGKVELMQRTVKVSIVNFTLCFQIIVCSFAKTVKTFLYEVNILTFSFFKEIQNFIFYIFRYLDFPRN